MADSAAAGRPKGPPVRGGLLRSTLSIYLAAGFCFGAGVVRDWAATALPSSGREFFEVMYVTSLASIWGINAIQLGTSPPTRRLLFDVVWISAITVVAASSGLSSCSTTGLVTAVTTSMLWLAGALASRAQLARGFAFTARSREAVASLSIAALILVGTNGFASLALGVAIGTAWMLVVSWGCRASYLSDSQGSMAMTASIRSIVVSNAAVAIMTLWAIHVNRLDTVIFGVPAQWAARLSSYLFQAIAIGWMVLAAKPELAPSWASRHGAVISMSLFIAAAACTAWSIEASCLVMPIFAGVGQYTLIAASARSRGRNAKE